MEQQNLINKLQLANIMNCNSLSSEVVFYEIRSYNLNIAQRFHDIIPGFFLSPAYFSINKESTKLIKSTIKLYIFDNIYIL